MDDAKRKALEAAGFAVGDAEDFLGLTPEERAEVERVRAEFRREHQNRQISLAFWVGFVMGGLFCLFFFRCLG